MTAIYSARWLLPIASPPIENGAVAVEGTKIVAIGEAAGVISRFPHASVSDFGFSAILPGLVNAHSHLELTVMRGFLEREESNFFAWLRKLTIARMAMTADDLFVSATCGLIEAARAGITCVGDSSSAATQSMRALREIGLRGIVYQESFGPDPKLAQNNFAKLQDQFGEVREHESDLVRAGVSPHAPYTVSAPQLELISRWALDEKLPLMMHAAESKAEEEFMQHARGPFAEGLRTRGIEWTPSATSTLQHLKRHGVLETKPLLAHCITVDDEDINTIHGAGAGIAHCPKSNAKLRHGRAPFAKFVAARVNVGLGSDSAASNNNCDIFEEARFATLLAHLPSPSGRGIGGEGLSAVNPSPNPLPEGEGTEGIGANKVDATQVLFAATLGGARALGLDRQIGSLAEGMEADLVVVGLDGAHQQPITNPIDALIFSSSGRDVRLTMVAGHEIYRDGELTTTAEGEMLTRLQLVRQKLDVFDQNK
jgi:5-methylthioadenosine/S-adenosylhomocysteine deaminase